jgi:hypothetical protein
MPDRTQGYTFHDGVSVPYVEKGGVKRLLTVHPTPTNHPVRGLPTYAQMSYPLIPLRSMKPFSRVWTAMPILDQGAIGACLPHAYTTATTIAFLLSGAPYTKLSPFFLYSTRAPTRATRSRR